MNDAEWEEFERQQKDMDAEDLLAELVDKFGQQAVDEWLDGKRNLPIKNIL
jgi:hypothetical protein